MFKGEPYAQKGNTFLTETNTENMLAIYRK